MATGMAADLIACLLAPRTLDPESLTADVALEAPSLDARLTRSRTPLAAERDVPDVPEPVDALGRGLRPRVLARELEAFPAPRELPPEPEFELEDLALAGDLPFEAFVRAGDLALEDLVLAGDLPFAEDDLLAVEPALLGVATPYLLNRFQRQLLT